ncbi:16835_t:CDS:1 [Dentiscutata heterogama]|uniref:16835_t:CDS:1 n=1 Tax=Dentiscutata heterogama TaxID=1316150 RepID=A0ACA9LD36_9GLOM|nr:16835_t:CDS:1 [Dentiscutata heterogama]
MKVENNDLEEQPIKLEPEDYSMEPVSRSFNNGVLGLGLLTSLFPGPRENLERRFVIKEYQRELEYQELVLEAIESGDELGDQNEMESEDDKENADPETEGEKNKKIWQDCNDDDKTIATQEGEDGCHKVQNEREVFMVKVEDEEGQKGYIKIEDVLPEPVSNEVNSQVWTQNMTPLYFKMSSEYHNALSFLHLNRYYGKTFHLYSHPIELEHFTLEVIN